MGDMEKMYEILGEMVSCAEKEEKERVFELNEKFSKLSLKVYHDPITNLQKKYDNCRQSCVVYVDTQSMFTENRKNVLIDAQQIFSEIPIPQ